MNNFTKFCIFLLFVLFQSNALLAQWESIGSDLIAPENQYEFGKSISLNRSGTILAVGAPGIENGSINVYEFDQGEWGLKGNIINGENTGDYTGYELDIDSAGNSIVVASCGYDGNSVNEGKAEVFEFNGAEWVRKGNIIMGETPHEWFGLTVSINGDGSVFASGTVEYDGENMEQSGKVQVFTFNGTDWIQKGQAFYGENDYDWLGSSVSLNSSGNIVAIGVSGGQTDENYYPGLVKVYEYNPVTEEWGLLGSVMEGVETGESMGTKVKLSSDGYTLITGCPGNNEAGQYYGAVRVYQFIEGDWQQKGSTIYGDFSEAWLGWAVDINSDGSVIAVGTDNSNDDLNEYSYVKTYVFEDNDWLQYCNTLYGTSYLREYGHSVALNGEGTLLAISDPFINMYQNRTGEVYVYKSPDHINIDEPEFKQTNVFPNPSPGLIHIHSSSNLKQMRILDLTGKLHLKLILTGKENEIDASSLNTGVYFIILYTESSILTKKLIIK